ncbi:hypothetical protein AALA82_15220 [Oscillospiraceae bacterium 50-16]|mgnify:FL=1
MMKTEKQKLQALGQQLSTLGVEFRLAQIGLERAVEQFGLSSQEAVEASQMCSILALRFTEAEEEFCSLLEKMQILS